ncbi:hypothetical protein pclt_cds_794 [Pandoravirus celtis]|uniref:Uncharacterized protein n=1 Tax=Pandoravirus celtis TaxID=2568002 RepID=A0A4D6EHU4_9VIRU|nr:hypothetical protein pclt_cds_794 [Pandoravirus celtis]
MGARMTAGLPTYDASGNDDETSANLIDNAPKADDGDALQRPGANAADTLRGLYRQPQVHFCCTTAAMRRIEALALRLPIDHVCVATGASTDPGAMVWWVAMSPRSHQLLLASQVVVEVDRRRHLPVPTPPPSPWSNQVVCSSSPPAGIVAVQEDAPAIQAKTSATVVPLATPPSRANDQPKRRRRRQRGRAKSAPAVGPLRRRSRCEPVLQIVSLSRPLPPKSHTAPTEKLVFVLCKNEEKNGKAKKKRFAKCSRRR